jgi:hypothetical protein
MKIFITILLSALLAYAAGIYGNLPWWSFAVTNLIVAVLIPQKPLVAFLTGAAGVGLLWMVLAILLDQGNDHILSTKVATILPLKGSYILLIVITSIVGGLVGGLASLTGSYMRKP